MVCDCCLGLSANMKIISVFGTRPEAIKMAPVVLELAKHDDIESKVLITAQHRELLDQVMGLFGLRSDYDLDIMRQEQTLSQVAIRILEEIGTIFETEKPNLVLVHGDTITAFVSSLAAFYYHLPVGHVEAGLRTYNKYDPFPEEINRQLIDVLADYYFAPTLLAKNNLIQENKREGDVFVTGNTVIDALLWVTNKDYPFLEEELRGIDFEDRRVILVTTHRRENLGKPMREIHRAIREIADLYEDVEIIFPVHPNPKVRKIVQEVLGEQKRIHLLNPLNYRDMVMVLKRCYFVMTDSGGLQEEAPALGKPVLVLRKTTERPEGVEAGTLKLVGIKGGDILCEAQKLLDDADVYRKMSRAVNPYGDGTAAQKIVKIIRDAYPDD